jgi:hypothetical protein
MVVNHTDRLKNALEVYLNSTAVNNLYDISFNLKNIEDDLEVNKRFFRKFEEIDQEAEQLKQQISVLRSGMNYPKYNVAALHLDSLKQLRRDLTDYSLQSAARLAVAYSEDITTNLPLIDFKAMNQSWVPIADRVNTLMINVNRTELKNLTSVSDRVADFLRDANQGFAYFINSNTSADLNVTNSASEDLASVYQEFLTDYFDKIDGLKGDGFKGYEISPELILKEVTKFDTGNLNPTIEQLQSVNEDGSEFLASLKELELRSDGETAFSSEQGKNWRKNEF